ncbi:Protein CBG02927 [Caenorhabditis briggsae]|uniref:Protein CBG02927 n=1 Tax=Caenorhabditis briggsae TaxID=6238 RepID=A8WT72_CAEBR|nr:Protein CBG02927 [Caenorhabditis briggsae]CAP23683.1 Protein CBG02927 [Caenorhabditis briggsae]
MRFLILALLVLFAITQAYPSSDYQPRHRKSQTQEANIQPFIRFRKSTQPQQNWMFRPDAAPYFE